MPLVGPYDLKTGLKMQIKALTSSLEHLEFIPRLFVCTLYILYGHHLSKKSKNLKKKNFFFWCGPGLPAGSGVLASQGDQPKKGGIFFFFFNDFNLCGV